MVRNAAFILDLDGTRLLFDPFFFRNDKSKPVLKTKREDVKNISAVFITHAHVDHVTDAAWYAENMNVPVYTSKNGKENMIKWCSGEIIDIDNFPIKFMAKSYPITEKGIKNINIINWGDNIRINDEISVDIIKSKHVKFDNETLSSRMNSKEFQKLMKVLVPIGTALPPGKVFGFCTNYKNKRIVSFGSLCDKFPDILEKFNDCDIFTAPLAGNSPDNIAKKGGNMTRILNPKIVIPLHWDDFFPPISRTEDLGPFKKYVKEKLADVKVVMPKIDEELNIEL